MRVADARAPMRGYTNGAPCQVERWWCCESDPKEGDESKRLQKPTNFLQHLKRFCDLGSNVVQPGLNHEAELRLLRKLPPI